MTKLSGSFYKGFLLVYAVISFIWLRSSYGKWVAEKPFVDNLAGTLGKFADKNPNLAVKSFLEGTAIPNAVTFGWLTLLSETLAGVGTAVAVIYLFTQKPSKNIVYLLIASLLTGAFLNLVFWLAAGYTSPSTDSLNLLMLLIQIIGFIFALKLLKDK